MRDKSHSLLLHVDTTETRADVCECGRVWEPRAYDSGPKQRSEDVVVIRLKQNYSVDLAYWSAFFVHALMLKLSKLPRL